MSQGLVSCPHELLLEIVDRHPYCSQRLKLLLTVFYFTPTSSFSYEYFPYLFAESVFNIYLNIFGVW